MTHDKSAREGPAPGYSLVELVIALACTAVLLSTATPNLSRLQQEWRLWSSTMLLESSLQWGRMQAIAMNSSLLFQVGDDRQRFYWIDPASGESYSGSVRHLPRRVRIASCPRRPLRFYQHGNAAPAGTYTLEGEAGSYSVVVSPGGRIRVQKD